MPVLFEGQQIQVSGRQILVQKELDSGAFGTVFGVCDCTSMQTCALKEVICYDERKARLAVREVSTLYKANHERIVRILVADVKMMQTGAALFLMLTEFCSGGDLNSRLNRNSSRETNLKWIGQISEALNYLHSLNPPIVHRDLKADNVLLKDPFTEDLKLGDFGLAREYLAIRYNYESVETYYMTSGVGPSHWMAPEFFRAHYTEKADIFSLGGIFYAILARDFIVVGSKKMYGVFYEDQFQRKVGLGIAMAELNPYAEVWFPMFPPHFQGSNAMVRLIKAMLSYTPDNRPSANEVLRYVVEIQNSIKLENTLSQQSTCTWR